MLHDPELHYLDNAATTIVAPEVADEESTNSVESTGFNHQKDCHNEIKTVQGVYCKHKEGCI